MARDSFIFYRSFYDAIKEISEEEQLKVYKAISIYALNQEEIDLTGTSKAIFSLIKPQLDANYKKYENGKQKGNKTKAKDKQKPSKIETNVNENENVNVNDNDNDNDNASDSCVDGLQNIIDFYENNIGVITPYGLETLQDFLKEMDSDVIIFAMQKAVEANVRTIQYIKGTLNNWSKLGIKTLLQAKEENEKFKKKQNKNKESKSSFNQRDYKDLNSFYSNLGE